ncbi:MAG TPA: sedoheptulose 7-phosphate cyclase [Bacillota bacterium]|nr:sedoheptulose 7-phosphate cyclase [Bacillota bacterium]
MGASRVMNVAGSREFFYEIVFGNHLFVTGNDTLSKYLTNKKCLVIMSDTISRLYYKNINNYFTTETSTGNFRIVKIKTGETNKEWVNVSLVIENAKKFDLGRRDLLIAIGGGILMDIVGFAASMYRRGIDYIRIPTTLVGQIDAGIGLKTGVNFSNSKNFIGSFYPPIAAINDIEFLRTLPVHEIQNGLAETIKMGIVTSKELFELLEENIRELLTRNFRAEVFNDIYYLAIDAMIHELSANFYEKVLERLVDFGHTFSPFIETHSNWSISHGFAVAMDMAISTELAYLLGYLSPDKYCRILNILLSSGLHIYDPRVYKPDLIHNSLKDIILHRGGALNLVVPDDIGSGKFIKNIDLITTERLNEAFCNLKNYQIRFQKNNSRYVNENCYSV